MLSCLGVCCYVQVVLLVLGGGVHPQSGTAISYSDNNSGTA